MYVCDVSALFAVAPLIKSRAVTDRRATLESISCLVRNSFRFGRYIGGTVECYIASDPEHCPLFVERVHTVYWCLGVPPASHSSSRCFHTRPKYKCGDTRIHVAFFFFFFKHEGQEQKNKKKEWCFL